MLGYPLRSFSLRAEGVSVYTVCVTGAARPPGLQVEGPLVPIGAPAFSLRVWGAGEVQDGFLMSLKIP